VLQLVICVVCRVKTAVHRDIDSVATACRQQLLVLLIGVEYDSTMFVEI
jgi:hypothetical protein